MKTKKNPARKLIKLAIAIVFLVFIGYSCGPSADQLKQKFENADAVGTSSEDSKASAFEQTEEMVKTDSISVPNDEIISSSAAVVSKDSSKKYIRTADIKFRVKNVRWCTLKIEDIIGSHNGIVEYTELRSEPMGTQIIAQSEDSSLEIIHFRVTNTMTLRVPNNELDSTLRAIGKLAEFLDFRIIKADNVTLSYLNKQKTAQRLSNYDKRISNTINDKGNKLTDINQAEENRLIRQEEADNNLIEKLSLQDKIDLSTIQLEIYQHASMMKTLVEREKEIEPYKPGFDTRLGNGVMTGWRILEYLVLAIVNLWSVLLIVAVTLFVIRFLIKRNKKQ